MSDTKNMSELLRQALRAKVESSADDPAVQRLAENLNRPAAPSIPPVDGLRFSEAVRVAKAGSPSLSEALSRYRESAPIRMTNRPLRSESPKSKPLFPEWQENPGPWLWGNPKENDR